jgi:hypothetical protein
MAPSKPEKLGKLQKELRKKKMHDILQGFQSLTSCHNTDGD